MLTDRDIQKLVTVFASKQEFNELKSEVFEMRETLNGVVTAIDGVAHTLEDMRMELISSIHQLNRHDRWIRTLADKTETLLLIEA